MKISRRPATTTSGVCMAAMSAFPAGNRRTADDLLHHKMPSSLGRSYRARLRIREFPKEVRYVARSRTVRSSACARVSDGNATPCTCPDTAAKDRRPSEFGGHPPGSRERATPRPYRELQINNAATKTSRARWLSARTMTGENRPERTAREDRLATARWLWPLGSLEHDGARC